MQDYQNKYLENCRAIQRLTAYPFPEAASFDEAFDAALADLRRCREIARQNTLLIQRDLLPVLDDLFRQDETTLRELEEFADALTKGPLAADVALSCQLHQALLNFARHSQSREDMIRELYKLGMANYALYNMLTGLDGPEAMHYTNRMRFCFIEAGSYLKHFEEFPTETQSYILRALANTYMGHYDTWQEKLSCVRRTMRVLTDEQYRAIAPDIPWETYVTVVHRQMTTSLTYTFYDGELSAEDVADVMESALVIYQEPVEKSRQSSVIHRSKDVMSYYSLEFACGLITRETLLDTMEEVMDDGDPGQYDPDNVYKIGSIPAFYAQYLQHMPEMLPDRQERLAQVYRRAIDYLTAVPQAETSDQILLCVRQLLSTFLEVEGGPTFRQICLTFMARFAPDLYSHGYAVGCIARTLCETIIDGDPRYFDDIPELAGLSEEDRRSAVLDMAYHAGLLHDLGKLNFTSLYQHQGRQLLEVEAEILQLHCHTGRARLAEQASTLPYADVAWGHHRWYDGSDGYPKEFHRRESPYRAMVDVIAFADFLERDDEEDTTLSVRFVPFEEKIAQAREREGTQFSPMITSWLRTPALLERLKPLYENGRREGYYQCFLHKSQAK